MNVVDNSVQAQFAALKKESDAYNRAADEAERERKREEHQLNSLQSTRLNLEEQLRVAHTELGTETRKKKILEDEKKRLVQTMEADRQAIVNITNELKGIDADEKKQKINFVKEMESLNNELDFLLTQCENQKTIGLLDAETINWFIETKLNKKILSVESSAGGEGGEDTVRMEEIDKWNEIISQAKAGLEALMEAQNKLSSAEKEKGDLENLVYGLRNKFLNDNGNIGDMEMDDLEAKWEQQWDYDDPATDNPDMDAEMRDASSGHDASAAAESVHLQLFYGAHEYGGGLESAHPSNASEFAA